MVEHSEKRQNNNPKQGERKIKKTDLFGVHLTQTLFLTILNVNFAIAGFLLAYS